MAISGIDARNQNEQVVVEEVVVDGAAAVGGNQTIAARKIVGNRWACQWKFGKEHAPIRNGISQIAIACRIHAIQSCSDYGDGRA